MSSELMRNRRYRKPQLFEMGRAIDILQRQTDGANKDRSAYQRVQAGRSSQAQALKSTSVGSSSGTQRLTAPESIQKKVDGVKASKR
jgi:hypothetical protein